jgi:hypothetical protein
MRHHWYGWVVIVGASLCGVLYAGSYLVDEIRIILDKYKPTASTVLFVAALFCAGATFGFSVLSALAPRSYIRRDGGPASFLRIIWYRLRYLALAVLMGYVTVVVLWAAYSG